MKLKSIRNIKIKTKLILLGAISIFGLFFIGGESIYTARQINQASTDISQSWMPSVIIAEELNTAISDYRIKEYYHVITHDKKTMETLETEMAQVRQNIQNLFKKYENFIADDTDRQLMESAKAYWDKYLAISDQLINISRQNHTEEAMNLIIGDSRVMFHNASSMFMAVVDYNRKGAENASVHADRLYKQLVRMKLVIVILISALIAMLVIYIISAIEKPVSKLVEGTRRVANGDLDVRLEYHSEDEIGTLIDSMNQLTDRLKNIIDDEKYLFREIGSENFDVKSSCQQAYRGDFAPILYSISSLMSRLGQAKEKQLADLKKREQHVAYQAEKRAREQMAANEAGGPRGRNQADGQGRGLAGKPGDGQGSDRQGRPGDGQGSDRQAKLPEGERRRAQAKPSEGRGGAQQGKPGEGEKRRPQAKPPEGRGGIRQAKPLEGQDGQPGMEAGQKAQGKPAKKAEEKGKADGDRTVDAANKKS